MNDVELIDNWDCPKPSGFGYCVMACNGNTDCGPNKKCVNDCYSNEYKIQSKININFVLYQVLERLRLYLPIHNELFEFDSKS